MLNRIKNEVVLKMKDFEPSDSRMEIVGVFNPGVALLGDEIVLLVRVAESPKDQRKGYLAATRVNVAKGKPVQDRKSVV